MPTKPTVDRSTENEQASSGDKHAGRRHIDTDRRQQDIDRRQQDADRRDEVSVAADYNAERRGFAGGADIEDWFAAEREIDGLNATSGAQPGDGSVSATVLAGEDSDGDRGHEDRLLQKPKPELKR